MQQVGNKKKSDPSWWDESLDYITEELERPAPQYYIDKVLKIYKDYFENYYAHLKSFDTGLHTISFHSRWNGVKTKKSF